MKEGSTYAWAVMLADQFNGTRWHVFAKRRLARAFRAEHGGELFHIVRVH
jgi:hypothetical protein